MLKRGTLVLGRHRTTWTFFLSFPNRSHYYHDSIWIAKHHKSLEKRWGLAPTRQTNQQTKEEQQKVNACQAIFTCKWTGWGELIKASSSTLHVILLWGLLGSPKTPWPALSYKPTSAVSHACMQSTTIPIKKKKAKVLQPTGSDVTITWLYIRATVLETRGQNLQKIPHELANTWVAHNRLSQDSWHSDRWPHTIQSGS